MTPVMRTQVARGSLMTELTPTQLREVFGFELSEQQWSAVAAPMSPAVMIAGAGSGKTTSMSARIAWLVGSGYTTPERILGLTFTTKATAQLLESSRSSIAQLADKFPLLVPEESTDPVISTYNSFAAGIVKEFGPLLGRDFKGDVLSEGARYQHAYRMVCHTSIDMSGVSYAPATVTSSMLALDSELSELAIEPSEIRQHDQRLLDYLLSFTKENDPFRKMLASAKNRIALSHLIDSWRELKADRDLMEFSDQVRLARQIVEQNPTVAQEIRSRFSVALLDEYQDTSISQRKLLQSIFATGFPLTAVGDPCQAIYGWRGASVANINDFTLHFPLESLAPSPVYPLSVNRRSGKKILEAANLISDTLRREHTQVEILEPAREHPGYLTLGLFEQAEDELTWLADRIAEQHAGLGPKEDIAVLSATTRYLVRMRDALRERGVPVQLHSTSDLLAEPIVMDLRALLSVVHEPTANSDFLRWASGVRWRIGARDLAALGQQANSLSKAAKRVKAETLDQALADAVDGIDAVDINSLSDALFDLGDPDRYSPEAFTRLEQMAAILRELRSATSMPLPEFVSYCMRVSGIDIQSKLDPNNDRDHIAVSAFLDLASEFTDIDGRVTLGAFLTRLSDIERFDIELDFEQPIDPGAVQLITVYKAKGLEFTHVYVPNMAEKSFPGGKARGTWTTDPSLVPWPIRHDAPSELADFPDYTTFNWPARVHDTEYKNHVKAHRELDSDRLAYVAFTRARDSLTVTSSWWGFGHAKPRAPHRYLTTLHDHFAGLDIEIASWASQPDAKAEPDSADPSIESESTWPEPVPAAIVASLNQQAHYVHSSTANPATATSPEQSSLNDSELAVVEQWQQALDRLREEDSRLNADTRVVPLPASLGASTYMRALREPEELAKDLARPMPRRPSVVAEKGTIVHALIEEHYKPKTLFDLAEYEDSESLTEVNNQSTSDVEACKQVFLASRFAGLTPVAVEQPFTISLGGMPVTGYIDAVFEVDGRYLVVDWKTGTTEHLDPTQLALYRIAWARLRGVDWREIDTCFVMLRDGEEISEQTDTLVEHLLARG